jgi:hypothetical protein
MPEWNGLPEQRRAQDVGVQMILSAELGSQEADHGVESQ